MKLRKRFWLEAFAFFDALLKWCGWRAARACGCPECNAMLILRAVRPHIDAAIRKAQDGLTVTDGPRVTSSTN